MTTARRNDRLQLIAALLGLAAAFLLAAWLLGYFQRDPLLSDDPAVADLQLAILQLDSAGLKGPQRTAADARLIRQYQQLSPQQQEELGRRKMLMYQPEQERELSEFFALSEAEQRAKIDLEIDAIEAKRQQWREGAGASGKAGGGADDPQRIMSMKQQWSASASPELRDMMDRRVRMINKRLADRGLEPL